LGAAIAPTAEGHAGRAGGVQQRVHVAGDRAGDGDALHRDGVDVADADVPAARTTAAGAPRDFRGERLVLRGEDGGLFQRGFELRVDVALDVLLLRARVLQVAQRRLLLGAVGVGRG